MMSQLEAFFLQTDLGKQAVEQHNAIDREKRLALDDEKSRLKTEAKKELPRLRKAKAVVKERRDQTNAQLKIDERDLQLARRAVRSASNRYSSRCDRIEIELRESAPAVIQDWIRRIDVACDKVRNSEIFITQIVGGTHWATGAPLRSAESNIDEIRGDCEKLQEAREKLEELQLSAPADWDAEIDKIVTPIEGMLK